ncbi:MAG: arylsulfatase [Opitutus sp.]|nr:arylsulfatase [Opitutus sp.]
MKSNITAALLFLLAADPLGAAAGVAPSTPPDENDFRGKIRRVANDSTPDWPRRPTAPLGAPNVILILLDDVGFGAMGTFGGVAATPVLDQLAAEGLRYNRFHVVGICSPTRASLLAGRNHHRVGFGTIAPWAAGFPGYDSVLRKKHVLIPEVLRRNGYNTAAFGKWHNTPSWEMNPSGPFDRWPTGLGFDYYYGFIQGDVNQYEPPLYRNTTPVEPPKTPTEGYHFTTDIVDEAIRWLRIHEVTSPQKPWFIYFAPGATHAPLHAPPEWIARYRGKFDQGWDKVREETFARQKQLGVIPADTVLTPRPPELPAWDSLSGAQKRLHARQEEVYAAFLAHTDHEIGRLLQVARQGPQADNTLVLYITGDNGASGEGGMEGTYDNSVSVGVPPRTLAEYSKSFDDLGGPLVYNHHPSAWGWATNTPFKWVKQVASHLGALRNPLVASWPARIKDRGGLRTQFTHVNDIAPTLYEAIGITAPAEVDGVPQEPLDGTSFLTSFADPKAPATHRVQYFEVAGNRAIYEDGWFASALHALPWDVSGRTDDYGRDRWELYHLDEDYSQAHDLAAKHPEKLAAMKALFDREAEANRVFPLVSAKTGQLYPFEGRPSTLGWGPNAAAIQGRPDPLQGKTEFVYYPDMPRLPGWSVPKLTGSHRITATFDAAQGTTEGILLAQGGRFGGFAFYIKDGRLVYESNFFGRSRDIVTSNIPVPAGKVEAVYTYTRETKEPWGGGTGRFFINGQPAGEGKIAHFWPADTLGVGRQFGSPVSSNYQIPFRFTGNLQTVVVRLQTP